jgi:Holliday junction DNA helicase RuvA
VGKEIMLFTSFIVREQSQTLYGFLTQAERQLFEQLLAINGIGPKSALGLIGHLPPPKFQDAILRNDLSVICKTPGIGKKTAQRLLLDMQDKLSLKGKKKPSDWQIEITSDPANQTITAAMSALINLGYDQTTAEKALKKSLKDEPNQMNLATLITCALKNV